MKLLTNCKRFSSGGVAVGGSVVIRTGACRASEGSGSRFEYQCMQKAGGDRNCALEISGTEVDRWWLSVETEREQAMRWAGLQRRFRRSGVWPGGRRFGRWR